MISCEVVAFVLGVPSCPVDQHTGGGHHWVVAGGAPVHPGSPILGADGLAHLFVDEEPLEDFGALVASQKTFVIPTASVLESVCGSAFNATLVSDARINVYLTEADRKSLRSTISAANVLDYVLE